MRDICRNRRAAVGTIRLLLAAAALAGLATAPSALANPPSAGSEDYDQLMPYSEWISGRTGNNGGLCCSISDCRVVSWRTNGSGYEAYIAKLDSRGFMKFPGAPNAWLSVPADVIKREVNPTGRAIACWSVNYKSESGFFCFFLPDLT